MKDTRMWMFALLIGALSSGNPNDRTPTFVPLKPVMPVGKATITVVEREVTCDGKRQLHTFATVDGDLKATVRFTFQETTIRPMSRVMPRPKPIWQRDIAIDTSKSRSIDLGVLAKPSSKNSYRALTGSVDGKRVWPLKMLGSPAAARSSASKVPLRSR